MAYSRRSSAGKARRAPARSGRTYNSSKRGSAKRSVRGGRKSTRAAAPRQMKIVIELAGADGVARPAMPQQVEKPTRKAKF